jgi:calcineurin-like phosphoesterase family protein
VAVRVAALSDVHGNVRALEALLSDAGGVDASVFGGDVFSGPWPGERLELVQSLGDRAQHVPADVVRSWPTTVILDSDTAVVLPREDRFDWIAFTAPLTHCGHLHVHATVDEIRRSDMPEPDEIADELLHPPTVEQVLERLP